MSFKITGCLCGISLLMLITGCAALFLDVPEFKEYQSRYLTYYYLPGSKTEKDIKEIAQKSEEALEWFFDKTGITVDFTARAYIFDDADSTSLNRLLPQLGDDLTVEMDFGMHVNYEQYEYNSTIVSVTILHEFVHVVQYHRMGLFNTGIGEGHAFYLSACYSGPIKEDTFINLYRDDTLEGLKRKNNLPTQLFAMTSNEFQRIDFVNLNRDEGYRYVITASFIAYLVAEYGMNALNKWLTDADINNFRTKFRDVYNKKIKSVENDWLQMLGQ